VLDRVAVVLELMPCREICGAAELAREGEDAMEMEFAHMWIQRHWSRPGKSGEGWARLLVAERKCARQGRRMEMAWGDHVLTQP